MKKKAVVLLSGGLDSATVLYEALKKNFNPVCLIFYYGQRHKKEIESAKRIARRARCPYQLIDITLPRRLGGGHTSSLVNKRMPLPQRSKADPKKIPSTYVPARNILFLSFAASFAEVNGAGAVFIGANAIDYSGYPDCRPEFLKAFETALQKGTKTGVEGKRVRIHAPLLKMTKAQIIKRGISLDVPYHLTWSCYQGGKIPCGKCESCLLRQKGFQEAGVTDPAGGKRQMR